MWNIPPIVGQKVMLNPSYVHYKDFNRAQARGKDGYILAVTGINLTKWLLGASEPAIIVMWENGHENSYELKALLPIDLFKTIERVEFKSGHFLNVLNERTKDIIAERVILKNDDIKHYANFDKAKRLDILVKAEATFQTLEDSNQNKESVQMKYMSILEEIERTKRAEEVPFFLESEGDDVTTPKKQLSQDQVTTAPLGHSDIERTLRDWEAMSPIADANLINPSRVYQASTRTAPYDAVRNPFDLRPSEVLVEGEFPTGRDLLRRAVVDADFFNPCAELPLNNSWTVSTPPGEVVTLTGRTGQGRSIYDISEEEFRANLSPYMEQMMREGQQAREMTEVHKQALIEAFNRQTRENARTLHQVPWWKTKMKIFNP